MRLASLLSLCVLGGLCGESPAQTIAVYPPDINLETARDRQSFVVQLTQPDGLTRDVTAQAQVTFADPTLVKLDAHYVRPVADGATEMSVTFGGQTVKIPVKVTKAKEDRAISFKQDVMPVFMRTGCNVGGCHGAARGKDGFRLSLFGFDPEGDHFRLTRELNGRRVNLALPGESLLVEKALGKVPHTGGAKIKEGDEYHQTLLRWLEADAPLDPPTVALPVSMEVFPPGAVLDGKGEKQRLVVRAKYSDGTDRDVTSLALFLTNNETAAKIDGDGTVTAGDRGEAFVMARFHTFTIGVPFITLPKGLKFAWSNPPETNYIDTLVHNKLKKLRIEPSGVCDDATFVRRVYLDIIGALPTPEEYARFMVSTLPTKREHLVDELLDRKEFAELWVLKWAELLQIRSSNDVSYKAMLLYYGWLQEKIANNVPTDEWVRELLGANGGTFKNPATNYYQLERDVLKVTENVAQVFMGMRIQCAQCHNHPFDRWTMDDYYSFASFFTQIGRKGTDDARELVVFNSGGGEVNHPVHKRPMPPKFLGGTAAADVAGKDRRVVVATWLASADNPYFAKNLSNIVWGHFFGQGIINEIDDVRISNPASNQELLDELGKRFTGYKYDFKKLVRDICTSQTYQRSTQPTKTNESDTRNFARGPIRRIRAETMLDIITQVTDTKNKFQGLPLGARAVQIADGGVSTYFLTTFGRPTRETVCSCEVRLEPTLSQSLHLLNGGTVEPKIAQGNLVGKMLQEKKTPAQIIEQMYVRCLSRAPKLEELKALLAAVDAAKDKKQALEDVFWAIMNSREFMFNH
ncbi:DUF1549 and DUF1553 domain-containing protein [Frigoriglobus tundricola]|uniref:Cell surface protein n=1 Tax=Frigoriglobus tundricola TaxID=2774151 RepID=A0A6M5YHN5_9BACT|nr:DUF1549 and DUF1553 domain-containing protein [Frigoriglobus tundricola]QJW93579.1 Uncharacterized protein FTUN_1086 [Frigoriglobus tundricola]